MYRALVVCLALPSLSGSLGVNDTDDALYQEYFGGQGDERALAFEDYGADEELKSPEYEEPLVLCYGGAECARIFGRGREPLLEQDDAGGQEGPRVTADQSDVHKTTDIGLYQTTDIPEAPPITVGRVITTNPPISNLTIERAINKFVSVYYPKILENSFKKGIRVPDFKIFFNERARRFDALVGDVAFRQGTINMKNPIRKVKSVSFQYSADQVRAEYQFSVAGMDIGFRYFLRVPLELFSGDLRVVLKDIVMTTVVLAAKRDGRCSYQGYFVIDLNQPFKDKLVRSNFKMKTGFKSIGKNKRAETVIHSLFARKDIYQGINLAFMNVDSTRLKEFLNLAEKNICDHIEEQ